MKPHITIPCPCEHCTLANTPAVRIAGTVRKPGEELHGVDAARFIRQQAGNLERVGDIAARLRQQFGIKP